MHIDGGEECLFWATLDVDDILGHVGAHDHLVLLGRVAGEAEVEHLAVARLQEQRAPADEGVDDFVGAIEHQVGEWLQVDVVHTTLALEAKKCVEATVVQHGAFDSNPKHTIIK